MNAFFIINAIGSFVQCSSSQKSCLVNSKHHNITYQCYLKERDYTYLYARHFLDYNPTYYKSAVQFGRKNIGKKRLNTGWQYLGLFTGIRLTENVTWLCIQELPRHLFKCKHLFITWGKDIQYVKGT